MKQTSLIFSIFFLSFSSFALGATDQKVSLPAHQEFHEDPAWQSPYLLDQHHSSCQRHLGRGGLRCKESQHSLTLLLPAGTSLRIDKDLVSPSLSVSRSSGTGLYLKLNEPDHVNKGHWFFDSHWRQPTLFLLDDLPHDTKEKIWVRHPTLPGQVYPPRHTVAPRGELHPNRRTLQLSHPARSLRLLPLEPLSPLILKFKKPSWIRIEAFSELDNTEPGIYESGFFILEHLDHPSVQHKRWTTRPEWRRHHDWDKEGEISKEIQWTPSVSFSGNVALHTSKPLLLRVLEYDTSPWIFSNNLLPVDRLWQDHLLALQDHISSPSGDNLLFPLRTRDLEGEIFDAHHSQQLHSLKWAQSLTKRAGLDPVLRGELSDLLTRFRWHRELGFKDRGGIEKPYRNFRLQNPWGTDGHLRMDTDQVRETEKKKIHWKPLSPKTPTATFTLPPEPGSSRLELLLGKEANEDLPESLVTVVRVDEQDFRGQVLRRHILKWQDFSRRYPDALSPSDAAPSTESQPLWAYSLKLEHLAQTRFLNLKLIFKENLVSRLDHRKVTKPLWIAARQEALRRDSFSPKENNVLLAWSGTTKHGLFTQLLSHAGNTLISDTPTTLADMAQQTLMLDMLPTVKTLLREGQAFEILGQDGDVPLQEKLRPEDPVDYRALLVRTSPGSQEEKEWSMKYAQTKSWDSFHKGRRSLETWLAWRHPTPERLNRLGSYLYHQGSFGDALTLLKLARDDKSRGLTRILETLEEDELLKVNGTDEDLFISTPGAAWADAKDSMDSSLADVSLTPVTHWAHSRWKLLPPESKLIIKVEGPQWVRTRLRPVFEKDETKADIFWKQGMDDDLQETVVLDHYPSSTLQAVDSDIQPGRSWSRRWHIPPGEHQVVFKSLGRPILFRLDRWTHPLVKEESSQEVDVASTQEIFEERTGGVIVIPPLSFEDSQPEYLPFPRGLNIVGPTPLPGGNQLVPFTWPTNVHLWPELTPFSDAHVKVKELGPLKSLLHYGSTASTSLAPNMDALTMSANILHHWPKGGFRDKMSLRLRKFTDWRSLEIPRSSAGHVFKDLLGWYPESEIAIRFARELGLTIGGPYRLFFTGTQSNFSVTSPKAGLATLNLSLHSKGVLKEPLPVFLEIQGRRIKVVLDSENSRNSLQLSLQEGQNQLGIHLPLKVAGAGLTLTLHDQEGKDLLYHGRTKRYLLSKPAQALKHRFPRSVWLRHSRWTSSGPKVNYRYLPKGKELTLESNKEEAWRIDVLIQARDKEEMDPFLLAMAQEPQPSSEEKPEPSGNVILFDTERESSQIRLTAVIEKLFSDAPLLSPTPKAEGFGTWEGGVAFSTGLDAEEENQGTSSDRLHLFAIHRVYDPWKKNYHRTRLDLSRLDSTPLVASVEHTLTHDHQLLPMTSRWSGKLAIQNFPGIGGTARSGQFSLELSRSIRWSPRFSRKPSVRMRWAKQQTQPRNRLPSYLVAPEIYSRYRHDHPFQFSLGEQWTWIQAENSRWNLTARLLGDKGDNLFVPDQGWLRLRWDAHLRQTIWRPSLRYIQRVNDDDRSSSSSETVFGLEGWILGPRKKAKIPLLRFSLDHRFKSEETRIGVELSLYGDRYRRLRDHREGDPPFLAHWRDRFKDSP